ncbi:hypothetical protein LEP1GSC040_3026 [Leptospira santarosai str. 2000030832]|nr:hypothetical protein LEP1GSC040_3026 [Leptospira santarosai str. 2000030832]
MNLQSLFQSVYNKFPIERSVESEIAKSRGAETHCFFLWVETKCWLFAKQRRAIRRL